MGPGGRGWANAAVGTLTSALQLGFIVGTLVFALLAIADRFSARHVFLICALAGAACTVGAWAMVRDFTALGLLADDRDRLRATPDGRRVLDRLTTELALA